MSATIALGNRVRDIVTGFEGTVTCRTEYLNGCIRVGVQPSVAADGKLPDSVYFDLEQVVKLADGVAKPAPVKRTGGDRMDPPQRATPSR